MEKVLLMTDFYLPVPSANGLCVKELADEFIRQGYETAVLCFGIDEPEEETVNGVKIYRVKAPLFYYLRERSKKNKKYLKLWNLERIIRKIKIIFLMPVYPMCFPFFAWKYKKRAEEIISQEGIKNVIGQYVPFEAAFAGYRLRGDGIKKILYVVDTFTQGINEQKYKCFGFFSGLWEKRFLKEYGKILYLENFKKYFQREDFQRFKEKIEFVSIPFLNMEANDSVVLQDEIIKKDKNTYSILYCGSWGGDRNPIPFCEALQSLQDNFNMAVQLYYCGYKNALIEKLMGRYGFIKNLGYIDISRMKSLMNSVDYLLNLGNKTNMLPSKMINYIATGKPIIHLYSSFCDPCISYMRKYTYGHIDNMYNIDICRLEQFIRSNIGKKMTKEQIWVNFTVCSPKYTVGIARKYFGSE